MELQKEYALVGATLIDGNGDSPLNNVAVVVKNGVIEEVGNRKSMKLEDGIQKVDASGFYLMPGLIDAHVHYSGVSGMPAESVDYGSPNMWLESNVTRAMRVTIEARKILDAGFTTVRSCGSNYDIPLRKVIEEGGIIGPRLIASGPVICALGDDDIRRDIYDMPYDLSSLTGPGTIPEHIGGGVVECRKIVRMLVNQAVDHIKIKITGTGSGPGDRQDDITFTREEVEAFIDEAHMHHKRVAVHCMCTEGTRMAVELGVNTIEHGDCDEGDIAVYDELCKVMVEKDIILVPTYSVRFIGPWAEKKIPERIIDAHKLAVKRGVKIALGSDPFADRLTPYGKFNIGEIKLLVDVLGLTPLEAITSATKIGAEACGIGDKVGTIEKGKLADILVVTGDPTNDIDILLNSENIKYIIKEGNLVIEH